MRLKRPNWFCDFAANLLLAPATTHPYVVHKFMRTISSIRRKPMLNYTSIGIIKQEHAGYTYLMNNNNQFWVQFAHSSKNNAASNKNWKPGAICLESVGPKTKESSL